MNDFLGKYYPGLKKRFHKERIERLEELVEIEKIKFEKLYGEHRPEGLNQA